MPEDETLVEVSGRQVRVTNPDKVYFPAIDATKFDLVQYYLAVGDALAVTATGRPALLQRFPHGATGKSFFQKRVPDNAPEWLETTIVATVNGTTSNALVVADTAHVIWTPERHNCGSVPIVRWMSASPMLPNTPHSNTMSAGTMPTYAADSDASPCTISTPVSSWRSAVRRARAALRGSSSPAVPRRRRAARGRAARPAGPALSGTRADHPDLAAGLVVQCLGDPPPHRGQSPGQRGVRIVVRLVPFGPVRFGHGITLWRRCRDHAPSG